MNRRLGPPGLVNFLITEIKKKLKELIASLTIFNHAKLVTGFVINKIPDGNLVSFNEL